MNLNVLKNRSFGSYFTAGVALVSVVAAIVYAGCYHNLPRFMDWGSFVVMLVGAVVALALLVFNKKVLDEVASAVLCICNVVGLCLFIQAIYNYVAVVMVGIDLTSFDPEFIASTVFFAIAVVAALVSFFLPKAKEND